MDVTIDTVSPARVHALDHLERVRKDTS